MTGFCVREMRREYRGVSRLYTGTAMLFLVAFACLSVIMRVRQADARLRLFLIGLDFVVVLGLLGVHLILTDERNLIHKTPFGAALRALGEPREMMRQIDLSAEKRFEQYNGFTLLEGWLLLYAPNGWKYEPKRVCARPVARKNIRAAEALPAGQALLSVRLTMNDGTAHELYDLPQQEWEALRTWLREQEQTM